jgi:lipopolysaccharide/colanic/teichoic acid biosynthesis glycosyltransferase
MYKLFIKRFLDVLFSLIGFLFVLPISMIVSLIIVLDSSGPIFFIQERLGKNAKNFRIYKFRTMTNKKRIVEREMEIYGDNPDVTFAGKFLRRFKIDELPQLINILLGDMSIVGPRPCMPEQLNELDENGIKRLEVLPGLTGLAQVNGNIYLDWPDRWKYDRYYVENLSFLLDLKIIFKTIRIFFQTEDQFLNKPQ